MRARADYGEVGEGQGIGDQIAEYGEEVEIRLKGGRGKACSPHFTEVGNCGRIQT